MVEVDRETGCVPMKHVVTTTLAGGTHVISVIPQNQTVKEAVMTMVGLTCFITCVNCVKHKLEPIDRLCKLLTNGNLFLKTRRMFNLSLMLILILKSFVNIGPGE